MVDIKEGFQITLELSSMESFAGSKKAEERERERKKKPHRPLLTYGPRHHQYGKELVIRRKGELEPIWAPNPP